MDVVSLLQSKNRCLKRFRLLCEEFLSRSQSEGLQDLDAFQNQRESILKALELYDRKITETVGLIPARDRTPALSSQVEAELLLKNEIIQDILNLDSGILSQIETQKALILGELQVTQKNKDLISKFKSTWVPESGEGLDRIR